MSKTGDRGELQQLSQLNSELSAQVTAVADQVERLQHQLELLARTESSQPPAGDRQSAAGDGQPASGADSGPTAELGSFYSAAGRLESSASGTSSTRQASRADRNVAMRHLRCAQVDSEPSESESESELADAERPDVSRGSSPPPDSSSAGGAGSRSVAADTHGLPSRELNLRVMYDVTLAHHDELEDCDLLHLNLREDEPSLETLCHDLQALADEPRCLLPAPPRPADLVFARWEGVWYRGRVVGAPSGTGADAAVEVQFVDYGNYDTVPLSECRRLPERLARMPVCAVECVPAAAVAAPAGARRQLQVLLIEALLAPDAPVRALFHRPAGGGLLQAQLAVSVTVGSEARLVDVGRTLNNVMNISLEDAAEQVGTGQRAGERYGGYCGRAGGGGMKMVMGQREAEKYGGYRGGGDEGVSGT